jgi:hypothetical protein
MTPLDDDYVNYTPTDEEEQSFLEHFYIPIEPRTLSQIREVYEQIKRKVDRSHAPQIMKCDHSKLADFVVLHSKLMIHLPDGQIIRGWMRSAKYGDTGTGKGATLRSIVYQIGLGERFIGESTGRTGLLYQINPDKHLLIWGALVLNDGGLVVIEGFHGQHADEIVQQREELDQGIVKVSRMMSGEALVRTRIICDMNPTVPIASAGLYTCQALLRLPSFHEQPDIRRFDIWVPHFSGQAGPRDIADATWSVPLIPNETTRNHVLLAWKKKAIEWDDTVSRQINEFRHISSC